MSDERLSPEASGHHLLRGAFAEIRESLDSLAGRFQRLETGRLPVASVTGRPEAPAASDALAVGREILAMPSSGLEPAEIFSLAADRVARLLSADRVMLFVWEEKSSCLRPRAGRGFRRDDLDTISIRTGAGLIGRAFQNEEIERGPGGPDTMTDDPFLSLFPARDAVAVPICFGGHAAGVLYTGRRAPRPPFSEQEMLLLLVIADRVGAALACASAARRAGGLR